MSGMVAGIIAAVAGSLLTAYFAHKRLKRAERERLELAAQKAYIQGKMDAEKAEEDAKNAVDNLDENTTVDVTDW